MNKGILYKTRCYLSGAMEYSNGQGWRNHVKDTLKGTGIIFFDPYDKPFITSVPEDEKVRRELSVSRESGDFNHLNGYMREVRSDDLRLCDIADFAIVSVSPAIPSWGTAEELTTLNRMKKPIFLCVEGGKKKCPLWIFGMLKESYIYNDLDEVITMINKINDREVATDSSKWRLLKPELR